MTRRTTAPMEAALRVAFEQTECKKQAEATFEEVTMPFRLLQSYVYRLHVGNEPRREADGRLKLCSSDTLEHPRPVLLALQGAAVLNTSLTCAAERELWQPIIRRVEQHLEVREDDGYVNDNVEREIVVATDGGCLRNGQASAVASWAYVVDNYVARAGRVPPYILDKDLRPTGVPMAPTNNRGELLALVTALRLLAQLKVPNRICVLSDSEYAIGVASKWMFGWERENEVGNRLNPDLVSLLLQTTAELGRDRIRYVHVPAHREGGQPPRRIPDSADRLSNAERIYLNSRADALASAQLRNVD